MGLLDVLNGMQNGPRGQSKPGGGSGGMSPITMAVLGLIAYKAIKSFTGAPAGAGASTGTNAGTQSTSPGGGGLGDLLKGGLGGLLAGGAAGGVLSGGLNDLLKQFQQTGQSDVAHSWIGSGPNKTISPNDLASALGADRINTLMSYSGMSRDDLLNGLSQQLPGVVDQLTPNGRLPTEQEAARLV
ncbi:MAG: YidB family protein [Xanthobacteraceae bacterium]